MLKPSPVDAAGHVVHLIERFDAAEHAPESLLLPKRMRTPGRVMFALVGLVATAGAVAALVLLWTDETPGWWFNLIFTVMICGIPVVVWAILIGSIRDARAERAFEETWQEHRHRARAASPGSSRSPRRVDARGRSGRPPSRTGRTPP